MRVIAGTVRGFRLQAPSGRRTRPTADRVREALFNILSPYVIDSRVLDLFAGSGAVGIEALSRGAVRAVFVEEHPAALKALRKNLDKTGMEEKAGIIPFDIETALKLLHKKKEMFDLVYLDPPYHQGMIASTLEGLAKGETVSPRGLVIAEASSRESIPEAVANFRCYRRQNYGDTDLIFFRNTNSDDDGGILG